MENYSNKNIINSSDVYKQQNISSSLYGVNLLDDNLCGEDIYNYIKLENIFKYNSYIQRSVTTYPSEMTKLYPNIKNEEDKIDLKLSRLLHKELQNLNTKVVLKESLIKTNIYGSYLIFLKTDSFSYEDPLGNDEKIVELNPYPFYRVGRNLIIENGIEKIEYYTLDGIKIHYSRVIRFDSSPVLHINEPPPSKIELIYPFYLNYIELLKTSKKLIKSQSTPVIMIKDLLTKLLRGGKDMRSKLLARLHLVNESMAKMNPIAIDKEQEAVSFGERGLAGVTESVDDAKNAFIGSTEVPGSILFQSPIRSGLFGDSSVGERMFLSQTTRNKQAILDEIYSIIIKQNLSIEDFVLEYPETLTLTPLEAAEMEERKARAGKMKEETETLKLNNDKFRKCYMDCGGEDPPTAVTNPLSNRNRMKEEDMTRLTR